MSKILKELRESDFSVCLIKDKGMLYATLLSKEKRRYATFRCKCGNEFTSPVNNVKRNPNASCGCRVSKTTSERNKTNSKDVKHHYLYQTWVNMKSRCKNKNTPYFKYYGGRGISVCDRWTNSFFDFVADIGEKPSCVHSIDRINNDGNYEPSNCRWATKSEQVNNRGAYNSYK